ncbi:MAG: archaellin/type IV pilin N-terminal domain-containing protein [Candidatus Heimdallarchaeota archaeon]
MRNIFKNKKAVSPVVATILLIALTVSAAAVVYFVVVPLLNQDVEITFGINTVSEFKDYDHDGSIDAIKANIIIVTTNGPGIANMTHFSYAISDGTNSYVWDLTNVGASQILDGKAGDVVLSATSIAGQLEEGISYTLSITFGNSEETKAFTPSGATLGSLLTVNVIDQDSDPVNGANVDFYYSNDAFTGVPTQTTSSSGQVEQALRIGEYKVRVSYLGQIYWSEAIYHPTVSSVTVQIGETGDLMKVHVQNDAGGINGLTVFSFDSLGRYSGEYAVTNSEGDAFLSISPGEYVFKVFYLGLNYSSPLVDYPSVTETTIDIGGGIVYARVVDSDEVGQYNLRVYVFSSTGSYLGLSARTNLTGYAAFSLSTGAYKFRVDYGGANTWSEVFGASDGAVITIYIGGKAYAHVIYGPDELPLNNVRVYLFTASGSYTGRSGRTNSTGYVLFNPIEKESWFKFRVDYAGGQEWSGEFNGSQAVTIVDINVGAEAYAHVIYGSEGSPLNNVRVYLFTASGSYSGISARTNTTGYARFNGVLKSTDYKFRVDYAGGQFWSAVFNGSASYVVVDINVGGTVYAHVVYGGGNLPINNVRVYLFTASGSYTGLSARTNSTGYARFNGVLATTTYRFRVDYAAGQFWSTTVDGSIDDLVVDINRGGTVFAHVVYGIEDNPLNNVRVYLFTASGSYTGLSARTNSTGHAQFNGVLSNTQYKFRVDYAAGQFWSTEFNGALPEYTHDINIGARVFCYAHNDGTPLTNVRVYLFREGGTYSGLSVRTNGTGYAEFNGVLSTYNYYFRITSGSTYLSGLFDGSIDKLVVEMDINILTPLSNGPIFDPIAIVVLPKETKFALVM